MQKAGQGALQDAKAVFMISGLENPPMFAYETNK